MESALAEVSRADGGGEGGDLRCASDGSGSAETADEFIRVGGDGGGRGQGDDPQFGPPADDGVRNNQWSGRTGNDTNSGEWRDIASGELAEASGMTGTAAGGGR